MKKIFLLVVSIALYSCDKAYTAKVYEENEILGDITNKDDFKAKDDIDGYFQGAAYYLSFKKMAETSKHGNVTGFDVYDENGINLKSKLNKHQTDSIMNLVDKNISETFSDSSTSKK